LALNLLLHQPAKALEESPRRSGITDDT